MSIPTRYVDYNGQKLPPSCRKCRYSVPTHFASDYICEHPNLGSKYDFVVGRVFVDSELCTVTRYDERKCGISGQWYEKFNWLKGLRLRLNSE